MTTAVGIEVFRDFAEIAKTELVVIDETPRCAVSRASCAGTRHTIDWPRASDPPRAHPLMRTLLSGTQHALRAGDYEAVIASVGASLRSLTFDGRDLTVPFDADEVRPSYRGATLAPWPNRIVDGQYTFEGVERQVPLTEPARTTRCTGSAAGSTMRRSTRARVT